MRFIFKCLNWLNVGILTLPTLQKLFQNSKFCGCLCVSNSAVLVRLVVGEWQSFSNNQTNKRLRVIVPFWFVWLLGNDCHSPTTKRTTGSSGRHYYLHINHTTYQYIDMSTILYASTSQLHKYRVTTRSRAGCPNFQLNAAHITPHQLYYYDNFYATTLL